MAYSKPVFGDPVTLSYQPGRTLVTTQRVLDLHHFLQRNRSNASQLRIEMHAAYETLEAWI
jgi:hypothetical protein